jgi:hypothetical protein
MNKYNGDPIRIIRLQEVKAGLGFGFLASDHVQEAHPELVDLGVGSRWGSEIGRQRVLAIRHSHGVLDAWI